MSGRLGRSAKEQDEGIVAQQVVKDGGVPGGDFLVGGDDVAGLAVADIQELALWLHMCRGGQQGILA
ncbi:hypothetical protein [Streptomyces sp. st77]